MAHNTTLAFQQLANGSYIKSTNTLYSSLTGFGDWWIFILVITTLLLAYIGTKDEGVLSAIGIFVSAFLAFKVPPAFHPIIYLILALSLAILLYRIFRSKN